MIKVVEQAAARKMPLDWKSCIATCMVCAQVELRDCLSSKHSAHAFSKVDMARLGGKGTHEGDPGSCKAGSSAGWPW